MIKAEVELEHWDGIEESECPNSLKLTNSEDRFVWVTVCAHNGVQYPVRVDINHLEKAVKAIRAGKE